ncbi:MAG: DUF92 domain-containing protein [Candidatus Freyarchaeota archaeon]|nr:DUF92 domain-containing protein [Candidatus Bathyarchaeota archaeon]
MSKGERQNMISLGSLFGLQAGEITNIAIGFIVVGGLGLASVKAKAVDVSGLLAGLVVGLAIWVFTSWTWFIMVMTFHIVAAVFTKYKYERKRKQGVAQEKGGARAWTNVFANGGVAAFLAVMEGLCLLAIPLGNFDMFLAGFLGAVATGTADTLATEIGLLYPKDPRLIINPLKRVPPGTSGGVSPLGEMAILLSGLIIGGVAALLYQLNLLDAVGGINGLIIRVIDYLGIGVPVWTKLLMISVMSGFIGSTVDSVIGATIQSLFKCNVCGKITEREEHCGQVTRQLKGYRVIDNNIVNLAATAVGALSGFVFYLLLF